MKTSVAFFLTLIFLTVFAQEQKNHAYILERKLALEWRLAGETRVWLSIENANSRDWPAEGWHPSYTAIFVKDCVPVVRKLGENRYEIAFRSEIAKDLP